MSADAPAAPVDLKFMVGARTLWRVRRRLVKLSVPLEQALAGTAPDLPGLPPLADGYHVRALPAPLLPLLAGRGLRAFVRQAYPRHHADLRQSYDAWFGGLSSKTRSTLKRKARKLAEESGGTLDIRYYAAPGEMADFFAQARAVSALTYQERLLDAGLPADALPGMIALAAQDMVRAWLLFLDGRPVAYLYCPASGDTLVYAYLGYDPAIADRSPGTVLQMEAFRMLMAEGRFARFDFTEGDGQHKRQFATGSVDSLDVLLLRDTARNRLAMGLLAALDGGVARGKALVGRIGLGGLRAAYGARAKRRS